MLPIKNDNLPHCKVYILWARYILNATQNPIRWSFFCIFAIMARIKLLILIPLLLLMYRHSIGQAPYPFGQFNMQGSTEPDPSNLTSCYSLTNDAANNLGTIWTNNSIDLNCPFELNFDIYLGNNNGADGMCFVIQNTSNTYLGATGSGGGGMGYLGFTNSFAIEFDTYPNNDVGNYNNFNYGNDPSSNHMCFFRNGVLQHGSANQIGPSRNILTTDMEDNSFHHLKITWNPTTQNVTCVYDNNPFYTISATVNLPSIIGSSTAYYGFSAATGGEFNRHKVCPLPNSPTILPPQNETGCAGAGYGFDVSSLGAGTYTWSPNTNLIDLSNGIAIANPTVNTDYTMTFTDPCGFVTIKHFIIDVSLTTSVDLGNPVNICPGSSTVITPNGNFNQIVDWTVNGVSTGITSPTYTATGNVTIGITVGLTGCGPTAYSSDVVTITETPLPFFTAGTSVTYCTPTGTSAVHTGANVPAGFGINWTTATGNITSGANTISPSIDLSGTYTLTLSGGTGCSATEDVVITVVDNPTVDLGTDFIHCGTGNYSITITNPYDQVVWGDGSIGNVYTSNVGGPVDVTVHVGTCTATDQVIVTQIIPTPPVAGAAITTCTNGSINLAGTADPTYTYLWTTNDGNILSNANTLTPTIDLTGTYTLSVTTPENCTASDAVLATLIPIPSVDLGANIQICPNENFVISVPNPSDYDVITWGDGSVGPGFGSNFPQTVTVEVETNGCTNTDLLVVSEYIAPSWDLGGDLTVCGDAPFSYNTGLPVTWFDGTQGTSYLNPPAGVLSATFYYGNNCPIVDQAMITIIPPTSIHLGNDTTICEGTTILLDAGVPVLWNGAINGNNNTFEVTQADQYTAYFTDGTCHAYDTINVAVQLLPIITWQGEETYCNGNSVILANPNSNATDFLWSTGETTEQITVREGNYYSLTVSNFCGSAFQDILLNFEDCDAYAFIPNAFTPDQDGLNEAWQPILVNAIGYEVFIYNRWGDQIFHSIDPNENWLGETHNGEYYNQDGTYSYRLILKSPDSTIKEYFGYFHLLR